MAALYVLRQPMRLYKISPNFLKYRYFSFTGQSFASKTQAEPEDVDPSSAPIKYSTSEAASHSAREAAYLVGRDKNRYEHEPAIVSLSLCIVTIYFIFLREESDIDEELGKNLYEMNPELEISHLKLKKELTPDEAERLRFLLKKYYNK